LAKCTSALAQQIQVSVPAAYFDKFGEEVLKEFRKPFQENVAKQGGRESLGNFDFVRFIGIEGTKKPSGRAAYFGSTAYKNGVAIYFGVEVRVKVDVGGGIFTTKVASVETQQIFMLSLVPTVRDNKGRIDVKLEKVMSIDARDGKAKERHVQELHDKVADAIVKQAEPEVKRLQEFIDKQVEAVSSQLNKLPGSDPRVPKTVVIIWPAQDDSLTAKIRTATAMKVDDVRHIEPYSSSGVVSKIIVRPPSISLEYNFDKSLLNHIQTMPLKGNIVISVQ
jgi:hypothetical protein